MRKLLTETTLEPQTLRDAIEKVKNASMKIGKAMYAQQQANQTTEGADQNQNQNQNQQGGEGNQGGDQGNKQP